MKTKGKVTLKKLADMAGCSTTTVSNILNSKGSFGEDIKEHVLKLVKEYNYTINSTARSLRLGKAETIGVLFYRPLADIFKSEYYLSLMWGLQKRLSELGFYVLLSELTEKENDIPRIVTCGKVDGIVLLGGMPGKMRNNILEYGMPAVMLDSFDPKQDSIYSDGFATTEKIVDYLYSMGHRRLAYFAYYHEDFNTEERIRGYLSAAKRHGMTATVNTDFPDAAGSLGVFDKVMKSKNPPTACLGCNDYLTSVLMHHARSVGIDVPRELSFFGHDNMDLSERCVPALSTANIDTVTMGSIGADRIIERLNDPSASPRNTVFSSKLVFRESVARIEG